MTSTNDKPQDNDCVKDAKNGEMYDTLKLWIDTIDGCGEPEVYAQFSNDSNFDIIVRTPDKTSFDRVIAYLKSKFGTLTFWPRLTNQLIIRYKFTFD